MRAAGSSAAVPGFYPDQCDDPYESMENTIMTGTRVMGIKVQLLVQ